MTDHIVVKMDPNQKAFPPCPTGTHPAVCTDVIDMGETVEQYEDNPPHLVHKIVLVFQVSEENPDTGKRYEPSIEFNVGAEYERGEGLRPTFGPRSKLRLMLGEWRGKKYTDEEARAGAPLHKLVGVNAVLNVLHKTSKQERVYATIEAINPPMKGLAKLEPKGYERSTHWAKRKGEYTEKAVAFRSATPPKPAAGYDELPPALQDADDDLPF